MHIDSIKLPVAPFYQLLVKLLLTAYIDIHVYTYLVRLKSTEGTVMLSLQSVDLNNKTYSRRQLVVQLISDLFCQDQTIWHLDSFLRECNGITYGMKCCILYFLTDNL